MPPEAAVALASTFFLIGLSLIAYWYVGPALARQPLFDALAPLALVHVFRPLSLLLFAPGVTVAPTLPRAFAVNTAYGDLLVAVLALAAVIALKQRWRFAIALTWLFNSVGILDALRNVVIGIRLSVIAHMGAVLYELVIGVPLILVTHVMVFALLLGKRPR